MSMQFGLQKDPMEAGYVVTPQSYGVQGQSNPIKSPIGSIYQPSSFFPLNSNLGKISMGPPPPSSNFGAQRFPGQLWNSVKNMGNTFNIFKRNPQVTSQNDGG